MFKNLKNISWGFWNEFCSGWWNDVEGSERTIVSILNWFSTYSDSIMFMVSMESCSRLLIFSKKVSEWFFLKNLLNLSQNFKQYRSRDVERYPLKNSDQNRLQDTSYRIPTWNFLRIGRIVNIILFGVIKDCLEICQEFFNDLSLRPPLKCCPIFILERLYLYFFFKVPHFSDNNGVRTYLTTIWWW